VNDSPRSQSNRPEAHEILRESQAESDRNFWTGRRSLTFVQWAGISVMYFAMAVLAFSTGYLAFMAVVAGLFSFILVGNYLYRRKHPPS